MLPINPGIGSLTRSYVTFGQCLLYLQLRLQTRRPKQMINARVSQLTKRHLDSLKSRSPVSFVQRNASIMYQTWLLWRQQMTWLYQRSWMCGLNTFVRCLAFGWRSMKMKREPFLNFSFFPKSASVRIRRGLSTKIYNHLNTWHQKLVLRFFFDFLASNGTVLSKISDQ